MPAQESAPLCRLSSIHTADNGGAQPEHAWFSSGNPDRRERLANFERHNT